MKDSRTAYNDMMSNLAKSTAAVPLHLQGAEGALSWWQSADSLLAKANISGETDEERLEKSQAAAAVAAAQAAEQAALETPTESDELAKSLTEMAAAAPSVEDDLNKAFADLDARATALLGRSK